SPARVFDAPARPDHLAAGDFDGDGKLDIALAAERGRAYSVLPGDGRGGFRPPVTVPLPGAVTALIAGEVDRAGAPEDIVRGVAAAEGPRLLVLESPPGALGAEPEAIDLPANASDLVLGRMDDDYLIDLAVAAGKSVVIVHGRDLLMNQVPLGTSRGSGNAVEA